MAFMSGLDSVSRGWPECILSIAATATVLEESNKLSFGEL
jgi:hypothetical protein